jgi:hypothetical protein
MVIRHQELRAGESCCGCSLRHSFEALGGTVRQCDRDISQFPTIMCSCAAPRPAAVLSMPAPVAMPSF